MNAKGHRNAVPFGIGGGEENRTPVRKQLDTTFSGCIMSFKFPLEKRRHTGFYLG